VKNLFCYVSAKFDRSLIELGHKQEHLKIALFTFCIIANTRPNLKPAGDVVGGGRH